MDYGARGRSGSRVDVESLERENDRGLDALSEKVALLKQATHNIRNEADSHHGILEKMEQGMFGARGMMSSVTDKFKSVVNDKQSFTTVMGCAGCVVGLVIIWYFMHS